MIRSYNELPLGKYMKVMDILGQKDTEEIDRLVSLVTVLNDKQEDEVLTLPIADFTAMAEATSFLYGERPQYTGKVTDKVVLGGQKLHITTGVNNLTTAQYIDFQTFAKDPQRHMVELVSIFLIPEGKKYNDGYDILEVQRIIRDNLTAPHATAIVGFFLRSLEISARATLIFLAWKMAWRKKKNKKALETIKEVQTSLTKNGAGLRQWMS